MSDSRRMRGLRRAFLYVALAGGGLVVIGLLVAVSVHFGIPFTGAWIGLLGYTGLLFWVVITKSRERWHYPAFWLTIAGLFAVHVLVFVAVLYRYPQWRMIWFVPIVILEAFLFSVVLNALFTSRTR